jgi:hypothetical protein
MLEDLVGAQAAAIAVGLVDETAGSWSPARDAVIEKRAPR